MLRPGDTAPDFTLPDEVGRPINLTAVLGLFGFGTRRVTYLVNRDGKIVDVVNAALRVGVHEALLRRALAAGSH